MVDIPSQSGKKTPLLSVVVIGHNEGKQLSRCLESIKMMKKIDGGMEIIYIDSFSSDDSIERAKKQGVLVFEDLAKKHTAASARNMGWKVAKGEYILFVDGDAVLDENFVRESMPHFSDERIAIVWGHRRELYPDFSVYNRVLDLDWIYPPGDSEFCGGDCLVRRAVLEEVGGYDAALVAGEEPEMCRRIRSKGYRILHIDKLMTFHDIGGWAILFVMFCLCWFIFSLLQPKSEHTPTEPS